MMILSQQTIGKKPWEYGKNRHHQSTRCEFRPNFFKTYSAGYSMLLFLLAVAHALPGSDDAAFARRKRARNERGRRDPRGPRPAQVGPDPQYGPNSNEDPQNGDPDSAPNANEDGAADPNPDAPIPAATARSRKRLDRAAIQDAARDLRARRLARKQGTSDPEQGVESDDQLLTGDDSKGKGGDSSQTLKGKLEKRLKEIEENPEVARPGEADRLKKRLAGWSKGGRRAVLGQRLQRLKQAIKHFVMKKKPHPRGGVQVDTGAENALVLVGMIVLFVVVVALLCKYGVPGCARWREKIPQALHRD
jgi:hypothetical protein